VVLSAASYLEAVIIVNSAATSSHTDIEAADTAR